MSKRSEMLALAQLLVDETATTEQAERLSCLLREDAILRQEYCEFVETHSALCWLHRDASSPEDTHLVRPSTESHRQRRTPYRTATLLSVAIAIAVLCGFFALRQRNDSEANRRARRVVSAALNAHRDSKEYRYRVAVTWDNALQNSLQGDREIRVSTRGDEFWIDVSGRQRFAIGQSPDQSAWVALNENVGLRIGSEEMGPVLQDLLELHSLRLESLLQGVLRDHRLKHVDGDESVDVIVAEPTRLVGWIRKVRFEVDRVSGRIFALQATGRSLLRGRFTVDFVLVDTLTPAEAKYRLEQHLVPTAEVLSLDRPREERRQVLQETLGMATRGWLVEPSGSESTSAIQ